MAGSAKNMFLFSLGLLVVSTGTFVGAGDTKGAIGSAGESGIMDVITNDSEETEGIAPKEDVREPEDKKVTSDDVCSAQSSSWFSSCTDGICNRVSSVKCYISGNPFKSIFIFIGAVRVAQWAKELCDFCCGVDDASTRRRRRMEGFPLSLDDA